MSRVKDNFPDFQSEFNNSPFYQSPIADNKIEYTVPYNDILASKELVSVSSMFLKLYPLGFIPPENVCDIKTEASISSVIILNAESNSKYNKIGEVPNLLNTLNFSSEDFGQLHCITLGKSLVYSISMSETPIKDNLDYLVKSYLDWTFKGDEDAKSFYFIKFRNAIEDFYNGFITYDNLADWQKSLIYILEIFFEIIDIIKEALGQFLVWIANGIRELKITDEKKWRPVDNEKGLQVYEPAFIPNLDLGIDFNAIEARYKEIDKTILNQINKFDWINGVNEKIADNGCQSFMLTLTKGFYSSVRDILVSVYTTLKDIYLGFIEFSRLLNAFLVGLYNGVIELVAAIIELIGNLLQSEKLKEIIQGFKDLVAKIAEEGIIQFLKDVFDDFIKKYQEAESSYDIAKFLGEDLAEIILDIIIGIMTAGGGVAYIASKKITLLTLKKTLKETKDLLSNPKLLKKKIEDKLKKKKEKTKVIDLNPRSFKYLTEEQKIAYLKQKEYLDSIKSEADFKTGTRKKTDSEGKPIERKNLNNTKGNWGEMKTDQFFLNLDQRWKPLHEMTANWNNPIDKGIDGIFQNMDFRPKPPPPEFIIAESKSFGATLIDTKSGFQMSSKWIGDRIEKAIRKSNPYLDDIAIEELVEKISDGYESVLISWKNINKEKKAKIQKLNKRGKAIEDIDENYFIKTQK
ncbi:MAG: hypothetical protein HWD85_12095 [Flavobacteriaceae bacterium]|nr:hypothetical protein [Flavobacteriaceae bacterium]